MDTIAKLFTLAALAAGITAAAAETIEYEASLTAGGGSSDFAPLYISSLTHGVISRSCNGLAGVSLWHDMDTTRRFSWGYGVKAYGGLQSAADYERYDPETQEWSFRSLRPSSVWLQELYGRVKYRGVFLTLGMEEQYSPLVNRRLSGGDLIQSGNTRPLPGARAGFIDFQNIPFTKGWVQIEGQLFYGKYTDSGWWAEHYNRYNGHITSGQWSIYRRCYFRTKPEKPLSVTVGVQCASQFGGTTDYYSKGSLWKSDKHPAKFKDFLKMFWPLEGSGEDFYQGNTLGSWDLKARYRLRDGSELKFYFQWPWEDGSGMGKLNGFDGLWGLEYDMSHRSKFIRAVLIEYLDLTNQSGPMHWDPDDHPGTSITHRAEGADDYYNNAFYNPYAIFGMAQGSPMVMSPIYNTDGYMQFIGNRMRGIHVAMEGIVGPEIDYCVKLGHRRAWGNGYVQLPSPIHSTSIMVEGRYKFPKVKGLSIGGRLGIDWGTMPGDAFGALVTLAYHGSFRIGGRK